MQNAPVAHPGAGPHHRVRPQVHLLSPRRTASGETTAEGSCNSPIRWEMTGVEQAGCPGEVQLGTASETMVFQPVSDQVSRW